MILLKSSNIIIINNTSTLCRTRVYNLEAIYQKHHLGKFDGNTDEGFFVGYSLNSKAFRVFNSRTRIVEENLHIRFSESTPNVVGSGPDWLFDIDAPTRTMNYEPIVAGTQSNSFAGTKASDNASQARKETEPVKDYILLPLWTADSPFSQKSKSSHDDGSKPSSDDGKKVDKDLRKDSECNDQEKEDNVNSTNTVNVAGTNEVNDVGGKTSIELLFDLNMPALEDYSIFDLSRDDEDDGAEADMNNLDTTIQVSPIPTTRIHKDHPLDQVIGDLQSATQTRKMSKNLKENGFEEPKKVIHALKDPSWIEAMQEELLQYKLQEVWTLVDLPNGKRAIGSKWVFRNKKDERGIMIRNKARLVAQGKIEEDVYVNHHDLEIQTFLIEYTRLKKHCMDYIKLLKLGMKACQHICWTMGFKEGKLTRPYSSKGTKMSSMGELTFFLGLQVKQKKDGIFISQDKYVDEILKKFGFTDVKTASTPMETQKPLLKDEDGEEVDVHMYTSMIGSLMYLTSSRPNIMFVVCACARYQVNPKVSHLYAVKRIFRYLKGQPKLGIWYPKDSPFDLVAYTDSDYAGASLDRKSTIGGCQFLGCRLISWQYKKQIVVANSTTEARRDLQLEDTEGVDCLPSSTIFEQLTLMGLKTTTWNEFSSTMASAIICLATNQKFNFSKFIFEDEAVHKELGDSLVRAATTASSLEAEQDSGNITKTRSKATPNESCSLGTTSGGGPRCQETMGDTIAQLVLDLEKTKTTQHNEIASLKRRVKKLEKKDKSRTHKLKRLYKVGLNPRVESYRDEENLVLFCAATTVTITTEEITLAQAWGLLEALKTSKPKVKGIVFQEPGKSTTTTTISSQQSQDKGKGIMIEEPVKPMKKKDQISFDKETALKNGCVSYKECVLSLAIFALERLQALMRGQEELFLSVM
ncbi:putative ribonuclease H-like domain-containing protein [Tanacetum coccineum]